MTITAKYASTCTVCHRHIAPGEKIEWQKGVTGVTHTSCGGHTTACRPSAPRPSASRPARLRAPQAGQQQISRDTDSYEVGVIIHASCIPGGGGTDGCYWTVVATGSHRISEGEDDTREGERRYDAIVRPATDDEAAACATRRAAAAQRKTRSTEIAALLRASRLIGPVDARLQSRPAGSVVIWQDVRSAGSETWLQAPDGSIWYSQSSYDDGPAVWATTATADLISEAKGLGLRAGI